jgi:hypothetical protein
MVTPDGRDHQSAHGPQGQGKIRKRECRRCQPGTAQTTRKAEQSRANRLLDGAKREPE